MYSAFYHLFIYSSILIYPFIYTVFYHLFIHLSVFIHSFALSSLCSSVKSACQLVAYLMYDYLCSRNVSHAHSTFTCVISSLFRSTHANLWGGSKEVIYFPWIFYAMRSLLPVGHLFTWLVCESFQWRHGLLFTDCIVWDDEDKVIGSKRSLWIHLG